MHVEIIDSGADLDTYGQIEGQLGCCGVEHGASPWPSRRRTARLDARFKERAEKVLWCYANAERLARRGIWVVCADEMPNLQVLERTPIRRAIPGSIEQREFEYTRHGTVNLLAFLVVHTGRMGAGRPGRTTTPSTTSRRLRSSGAGTGTCGAST